MSTPEAASAVPPAVPALSFPVERLRLQPERDEDCALFAVQNFFVSRNVEPPAVEDLRRYLIEHCGKTLADVRAGIGIVDQIALLEAFSFPALVALACIPVGLTERDVFAPLLAQGFGVLFSYRHWFGDSYRTHSVVLHACADDWLEVLDSQSDSFRGTLLPKWRMTPDDVDALLAAVAVDGELRPHGTVLRLPYGLMNLDEEHALRLHGPDASVVGIARMFIVAWPVGFTCKENSL